MRISIILLLFTCYYSTAQQTFSHLYELGTPFAECYDILATRDGGFLISGTTQTLSGGIDAYLIKLDQNGETVWSNTYDFDHGVFVDLITSSIELDTAYAALCFTWKIDEGLNDFTNILMLDKDDGSILKCINIPNTTTDIPYRLSTYRDGLILKSNGNVELNGEDYTGSRLIYFNSEGQVNWDNTYDETFFKVSSDFHQNDIHITDENTIYGAAGGRDTTGNQYHLNFFKVDSTGQLEWNVTIDSTWVANDMTATSDGFVVCSREQKNTRAILMKFDDEGNVIWSKFYNEYLININAVKADTNDDLYVTGYNTSGDLVVFKTDPDGQVLWEQVYENEAPITNYFPRAMTLTNEKAVAITGYVQCNMVNGPCGIFIFRLNRDGELGDIILNEHKVLPTLSAKVYPNPSSDWVNINFPLEDTYQIQLYDIKGNLIQAVSVYGLQHQLNIQNFKPASYILSVRNSKNHNYQTLIQKQ